MMIKKWLSVLLACCMLFTLAPSIVLADDAASLVVSSAQAKAGETVPVTVSLKNNPGVISLAFNVTFSDKLELTAIPTVSEKFPFTEGVDNSKLQSPYLLDLGDPNVTTNITDDGVVATFQFKVKDGTAPGDYEVSIDAASQDNYDDTLADSVNFEVVSGKVTVVTENPGEETPGGDVGADAASLVVSSAQAKAGETVPVTVSLKNNPGVISLAFNVTFSDKLELTAIPTVSEKFPFTEGVDNSKLESPYLLDLGDPSVTTNITDDGVVATFQFKVKDGTAPGDYEVSVDKASQDNYDETLADPVEFEVVPGKVTVTDEPTSHSVTCPTNLEGGTVTANPASAVKDTDITLTVTPNKGYGVATVTWNNNVLNAAPYTFTMPDEDVTVSVTFSKLPYDITCATATGGKVSVEGDLKTATVGTEITLKVEPAEGYVLDTLTVDGEETKNIPVENDKFTMPAEDVTVTATFKEEETKPYTITYPENTEGGAVDGPKEAYEGNSVKLTVTPDEGYDADRVTLNTNRPLDPPYEFAMPGDNVTVDAQFVKHPYSIDYTFGPEAGGTVNGPETAVFDEEVTINASVNDGYRLLEVTVDGEKVEDVNGVVTFTMPKNDVKVQVTFAKLYNITYVSAPTNGGSVKDGPTEAVLGEEIELTATANEDADYDFVEFTVVGDESEKTVEVNEDGKFVMPEENVTVTAWFTQPLRTIAPVVATPAEGGEVKTDPTSARKGSLVTVTVTPKTGYVVTKVTADGEEATKVNDTTYTFTMPAHSPKVEATFAQQTYKITYALDPAAGGSVKDGPTEAKADEEVSVSLNVNDGYDVAVTADGKTVEDVNGVCTFTMPDHDVAVQVTFTRPQVAVTLVTNDGQKVDPLYVTTGEKIAKLGDRIWNNHTFAGWYADAEYKTEFDFDAPITGDTTIYAKWTVTVTFDANGGKFGESETTEVPATVGASIQQPAENPTRDGYTFTGWFAEEDKDKEDATAVDFTALTAQDPVTFYAGWDKDKIPVTYQTTGSGTIDGPAAAKPGETVTVKAIPSGDSVLFLGWNITSGGTEIYNDADSEEPKSEYAFTVPENATSVTVEATFLGSPNGGCYIATSVYGSYDTPEVWTLRRFRDDVLGQTWYGRLFIKAYYATSPTLVRWFGDAEWFRNFWRDKLDTLVDNLQEDGFESTPYQDKDW